MSYWQAEGHEARILQHIANDVHAILLLLKPPTTTAVAVQFTGATMQPDNTLVLSVGQTSQGSILPLGAGGIASSGVVSNVAYNFNDPSATVTLNPDGLTCTVTGVAASTGPITGTATCTVTDTDGVVSQWSQDFTITTNAVAPPPQQITQSIAVQFSDPTGSGSVVAPTLTAGVSADVRSH